MKESFTKRLTKAVTQTLRLDQLAQTLHFSVSGCCPTCRLVQPMSKDPCRAGCESPPRRITEGDEAFFELLPTTLQVIPENPKKLRGVRIASGMTAYVVTLAGLVWALPHTDAGIMIAIAGASTVPLGFTMAPRLKRAPPTTTKVLSAAPLIPSLPAPSGETLTGAAGPLSQQVTSYLEGRKCLACELRGTNPNGQVVIRARQGAAFQVKTGSHISVVRGGLDLSGAASATSHDLDTKHLPKLGLKDADLSQVQWSERVLYAGAQVRVHGTPRKGMTPELAGYRDEFVDIFENPTGTLVEVLS